MKMGINEDFADHLSLLGRYGREYTLNTLQDLGKTCNVDKLIQIPGKCFNAVADNAIKLLDEVTADWFDTPIKGVPLNAAKEGIDLRKESEKRLSENPLNGSYGTFSRSFRAASTISCVEESSPVTSCGVAPEDSGHGMACVDFKIDPSPAKILENGLRPTKTDQNEVIIESRRPGCPITDETNVGAEISCGFYSDHVCAANIDPKTELMEEFEDIDLEDSWDDDDEDYDFAPATYKYRRSYKVRVGAKLLSKLRWLKDKRACGIDRRIQRTKNREQSAESSVCKISLDDSMESDWEIL